MRRYGIRDDQWERIRDLLPGQEGHVGVTAADNRVFVEAVLYRYRTGMPWRDLRAARAWHEAQQNKTLLQARRSRFPKNLEREAEVHRKSAEPIVTLSPDDV